MAQEPGEWRSTILDAPVADARGVRIGAAFAGDAGHVRFDGVDAHLHDIVAWPRPWHGTGPFGHLPFLRQFWRPLVLRARASGAVGDWDLDGATAYVERNWGPGFPPVWWWGEAHDFGGDPVTVAFAGGPALGPLHATALVVHVGSRLVRRGEPVLAGVKAETSPGRWRLRGRGVEIEAEADPDAAYVLDVPVPAERRTVPWSRQHLTGRLRVRVAPRGRLLYEGETALAGLEQGRGA
jgi:hypothetical protein